jgi:hypothetical protein
VLQICADSELILDDHQLQSANTKALTYLNCSPLAPSVCHGMLPAATLTLLSEVEDVGLRPVGWSIELTLADEEEQNYQSRNLQDRKLQT